MFGEYLRKWKLTVDGDPIATHSSDLLPVRLEGMAAMLKLARTVEEERGNRLMVAWDGQGAARVLAHDGSAILLERATGERSLATMAKGGADEAATAILCAVAARLHAIERACAGELCPLDIWFTELRRRAPRDGGWLAKAAAVAEELLASQSDLAVLHGDLHHWNVLDFAGE